MLVVIVGLVSAVIFGTADFFGGLASKRVSPVRVVAISATIGLAVLSIATLLVGGRFSWEAVLWGGLSGVVGSVAILTWGLLQGERLSLLGYVALGIALVAVVLVGFVPEKGAVRPSLRGVGYAVVSGVLIGVLLILLNQAPSDSGLLPLVFNRASYLVILWGIVLVLLLRGRVRGDGPAPSIRPVLPLIIGAGISDSLANTLIIVGLRLGDLSVIAVLTALYPAGTIALAAIVLRERIAPVQWAGLALALVAAALLALA
jgi:drug/metabolite transporter (DMT)-like permease